METKTCIDCSAYFDLTSAEIDFYLRKFGKENTPKRCKPCRAARKQANNGGYYGKNEGLIRKTY